MIVDDMTPEEEAHWKEYQRRLENTYYRPNALLDDDPVERPVHYLIHLGGDNYVEVYQLRMALLAHLDDLGVPAGQVDDYSRAWEYLTRMWRKNGVEDAKKAQWYLRKLIQKLEEDDGR